MNKTLICINCPLGCAVTVTIERGEVTAVTGNGCQRGAAYARQEILAPARMVTTTVPVTGGSLAWVPVKTAAPIPKEQVLACMAHLRTVRAQAPLRRGDRVGEFAGTAIVVTRDIEA